MNENFEFCLAHVLVYEGGYSDHPSDPGGATMKGITHITLAEWRGVESVTKDEVRKLDDAEIAAIYRARYWDAARCGELPNGLDLAVFDCAVNQGVGRAIRLLQAAAKVTEDGLFGPVTSRAIEAAPIDQLIIEFSAQRANAYGKLATLFRTFGLGWSRRLMRSQFAALSLALGQPKSVQPHTPDRQQEETQMPSYSVPNPNYQPPSDSPSASPSISIPGTAIDAIFGGAALFGRKTIIGIVGYVIVTIASKLGIAPQYLTPDMVEMLSTALLGLAGLGGASKVERLTKVILANQNQSKDPFAPK